MILYASGCLVGASPLVLYQMGKVGSSTLWRSLRRFDLGRPAFRVHALTERHLDSALRGVGVSEREYFEKRSPDNLIGRYLRRELSRIRGRDRWKVITLVRDPLAQNVSAFFQTLDLHFPQLLDQEYQGEQYLEEMVDRYLKAYPPDSVFNRWFDTELKEVFGIDVFSVPFPWDAGFQIYEAADADILLIRLEDLDRCGAEAMQEFLGIREFQVIHKNVGSQKDYADLYRVFRSQAQFPSDYVDKVYYSRYARQFYAPHEIETFKKRWRVSDRTDLALPAPFNEVNRESDDLVTEDIAE